MLQDRIMQNAQYFKGIEMMSGYPILKVQYPPKWGVFPSKDEKIKVTRSEEVADEWFYFTTDVSTSLDDMFDLMEETIRVNISAIEKIELLKKKVEELKELFASTPLEKLQGLQFTFEEEPKPTKKRGRKKKVAVVVDNIEENKEEEKVVEPCV